MTFSNVVGVPLLIAGTPKAKSLFEKTFRLARRFCDPGSILFTNLAEDEEWEHFLERLFQYQWIKNPYLLDKKMSKALYKLTQGIHSLVIRIFQIAQITAIRDGTEQLSIQLFEETAKSRFGLVQPMLSALRSKRKNRIELYDDLLMEALVSLENEVHQKSQSARLKSVAENRQHKGAQLAAVSALIAMGLPQTQAMNAVVTSLNQQPDLTGDALVQVAAERAGIAGPDIDDAFDGSDLTLSEIVDGTSTAEEAIQALRDAGVMK